MPNDLQQFLDDNLLYLFGFVMVWCICGFGLIWFLMKKKRITFPDKSSVIIKFEEKMASGRSHKSVITKLGGGRNCLNVVVTDQELWINTFFPFNLVAVFYDGIHKISLNSIQSVEKSEQSIFVNFKRQNGEKGKFELLLKNSEKFIQTIKGNS